MNSDSIDLVVIGLGYVGLPLVQEACAGSTTPVVVPGQVVDSSTTRVVKLDVSIDAVGTFLNCVDLMQGLREGGLAVLLQDHSAYTEQILGSAPWPILEGF